MGSRVRSCLIIFGLCTLLPACSTSFRSSRPYAGLERFFEPGNPRFDVQVHPSIENGVRGLRIDVSVPELTLVFRRSGPVLQAGMEWLIRVLDGTTERVLDETTRRMTLSRRPDQTPSLFRAGSQSSFFQMPPGKYTIEVVLEDLASAKLERKVLYTEIPAQAEPLSVTDLLIENASGGPLIGLQIAEDTTALNGYFYLTGNVSRAVNMRSRLLQLAVDSSAARPPFWNGPDVRGRIRNPVIVLDTLLTSRKPLRRGPIHRVNIPLVPLAQGLYRLEVDLDDTLMEGVPTTRTLTRYIVVRAQTFPRVTSYRAMIPPMEYLARSDEWDHLRRSIGTESERQRFDTFWGRQMRDRSLASNVVSTFYNRVEEANLRYSDTREGWKTDRGMVYILMGEPLFVEQTLEAETWFYTYDEGRVERTFRFFKTARSELPDILQTFTLERSFDYEPFWTHLVERWRKGEVF